MVEVLGWKGEEENGSGGNLGLKRKEEREKATYSTASLPLGFVFQPTDEQLISHYLRLKNEGRHSDVQIIPEVDFFNYDPCDLPALSVLKSDNPQWYFFCLEKKNLREKRIKPSRGGFWKMIGLARNIMSSKGLIGEKTSYVFYRHLSPGHRRTDWITYCYRAAETGSTGENAFLLYVLSCKDAPSTPILSDDGLDKRLKAPLHEASAAPLHEATAAASPVTDGSLTPIPLTPIRLDGLPVDKGQNAVDEPFESDSPAMDYHFASIEEACKAMDEHFEFDSPATDYSFAGIDEAWEDPILRDVPLSPVPSDGLPVENKGKELPLKTSEDNITTESRARLSWAEISCWELNSAVQSAGVLGGKKIEVDEIEAEPRPSDVGRKTFSFGLGTFPDTITQHQVPQSFRMWAGLGLAEPPQGEPWDNAKEIHLMDNELSVLPENPWCPVLSTLFLQRNYKLRTIPPSFFDYMPALQILNLSRTGIKSLPESIIKLVCLNRLFLNDCPNFMVLSPRVGELKQLEVLDLEGTDIKYLPEEIKNLTKLTCLEVSLYGYGRRIVQPYPVVPYGIVSALSHLEELSIKVNPDDERWYSCVEAIATEVCTLGHLSSLKFYFPRVELLGKVLLSSAIWKFPSLSQFRFTVGHHVERIMSRLPSDVELELERWERCLKYINGVAVPIDIKKALQYSTAFFLERHVTVKKFSDFGIGNMEQLKCCVLGECNEIEFIIDEANAQGEDSEADSQEDGEADVQDAGDEVNAYNEDDVEFIIDEADIQREESEANVHEESDEIDAYKEDDEVDTCEEDDDLDAHKDDNGLDAHEEDENNEIESKTSRAKKVVLGSLEYLFIYYMKNLKKIWKGPVQPRSLSLLKFLTLRTCPQLTTIFTETLLDNLYNLEELTIEDCPSVTTLVSYEILADKKASSTLPNLKRILLHYMPRLVSFSTGLLIAPKIEWMSFYNCPNLKSLLIEELCSKNLKRVKGERSWWGALEWRSGCPAYLDDIFVPIN